MSPDFVARQRALRRAMLGELYTARAEGRVVYARDLTAQAGQAEAEARFALDYLRREHPRLLYIGLGDTDDYAHDKKYELMLESLHRADRFLAALWTQLQAMSSYRFWYTTRVRSSSAIRSAGVERE